LSLTLVPIRERTGATSYILRTSLEVLKTIFAEDRRSRGFSDVVKAAYAQLVGHAPDPVS
jgi:hypothetical protein